MPDSADDGRLHHGFSLENVDVIQVLNPVVALAADETGTVNLFSGANDPESFVAFFDEEKGMLDGYILVIANPKYNPYEGTIEMANWTLLRILPNLEAE